MQKPHPTFSSLPCMRIQVAQRLAPPPDVPREVYALVEGRRQLPEEFLTTAWDSCYVGRPHQGMDRLWQ